MRNAAIENPGETSEAALLTPVQPFGGRQASAGNLITPAQFETLALSAMSEHFGQELRPGAIPGVPKKFDLVAEDHSVVGDAKYFTLVRGEAQPSAKFSIIAEYVWLLGKTKAKNQFLVFGNERRVPEIWLSKFGHLLDGVIFFFLETDGTLEELP